MNTEVLLREIWHWATANGYPRIKDEEGFLTMCGGKAPWLWFIYHVEKLRPELQRAILRRTVKAIRAICPGARFEGISESELEESEKRRRGGRK